MRNYIWCQTDHNFMKSMIMSIIQFLLQEKRVKELQHLDLYIKDNGTQDT